MLALGDRLRARGHEIVVCAPPDFAADAQAHGFPFHAVGRAARETLGEQAEAVVKGGLRMLRAANGYIEGALRAQFEVLPDATSGAQRIIGAGVQLAGASVAERHGVAYRYVAYVPTLLPSSEHAPFLLPLPKLPRWGNRLAWWLLMHGYDAMLRGMFARERAALGLRAVAQRDGPLRDRSPAARGRSRARPLARGSAGSHHGDRLPAPGRRARAAAEARGLPRVGPAPGVPRLRQHDGHRRGRDDGSAACARSSSPAAARSSPKAGPASDGGRCRRACSRSDRSRMRGCFRAWRRSSTTAARAPPPPRRARACPRSSCRISSIRSIGASA